MYKLLAALLISILGIPTGGFAQTWPMSKGREGTLQMLADEMNRESTRFIARQADLSRQSAKRSWPGRHPVLFGALVGLGVGLVVEAAVIPGASGGEPHRAYLPLFGGVGAGAGSLAGLIVSAARQ